MFATTTRKAGIGIGILLVAAMLLTLGLAELGESQQTGPAVTLDLWAKNGTANLPGGQQVPTWGYTETQGGSAGLTGPVLKVNQGEEVSVVLHNNLGRETSLLFPGQDMAPNTVGVASGATKTYTFTAGEPGTFLYESGTNPQKQVQMGLAGALVVRPNTANQAYNDPSTAYDKEAVFILSEVDPNLNAAPNSFNMLNFDPKYWLINGKAYPQTDDTVAAAGDKVLFRYLNAGYQNHTLRLLGMDQLVIAGDAHPLDSPTGGFTQTLAPGETYDLIGQIPPGTASGTEFPLYSRQMQITNGGGSSPGGMMTFVKVQ